MKLAEQFERLIKTLQLIENEPGKWDVPQLELYFNVGRATIERDIRILRKWGTIQRKNGYFSVKNLQFLPTGFTTSEAIAIMIACSMIGKRIGIPGSDALNSALRKIHSLLPDQVDTLVRKLEDRFSVGIELIRECNSEDLDTLNSAILDHHRVEITYYVVARDETTRRKVDPYGLTFRFGAWYLIGYCHLRGDVRTFGVDRIKSIRVLHDEHFQYPAEFNLESYLERGWSLQADAEPQRVVLRFAREIAPWIKECKFHPKQKITMQGDGSALFEVTVAGVDEIRHWILSFGDKVEVLEPESLRLSIADICSRMSNIYKSTS